MEKKRIEKGELILLGVFALFVAAFLFDIRTLPMAGKMLSYIAAPFILLTMLLCVRGVFTASEKASAGTEGGDEKQDGLERKQSLFRFNLTIAAGIFMFVSIYLVGFYIGSGLTMLLWFAVLKKLDLGALSLSIGTPLLLYLTFEMLLDMGLPSGELFNWLGF